MSAFAVNLLSAIAISVVITGMVAVKSQRAKALIVVLPIPITIALLGSGGRATSLSLVGLALTNCFVSGVTVAYRRGWNILATDALAVVLYVALAYVITSIVQPTFLTISVLYLAGWIVAMLIVTRIKLKRSARPASMLPLMLRSLIVFVIAYALFSFKQYLAAFVVTFPYNSVFAVYENRQNLLVQATLFTRNSIALWAYFVVNYCLTRSGGHWYAYVASWAAFGVVVVAVSRKLPLNIPEASA